VSRYTFYKMSTLERHRLWEQDVEYIVTDFTMRRAPACESLVTTSCYRLCNRPHESVMSASTDFTTVQE